MLAVLQLLDRGTYPLGTKEPMKDQNDEVVIDDIMMMTM